MTKWDAKVEVHGRKRWDECGVEIGALGEQRGDNAFEMSPVKLIFSY